MMNYRLFTLLLCGLASVAQAAPITLNETQTVNQNGTGGGLTVAYPAVNISNGSTQSIALCIKSEFSTGQLSSVAGTGGDTFTMLTDQSHSLGEPHDRCAYMLAPTANASYVATMTFSSTATSYLRGVLRVFNHAGTMTAEVDVGSTEDDTDTTPSSNTFSTTSTDEVCIAHHADYTTQTFSSPTINGVAATGSTDLGDTLNFYSILSATVSGATSSLTRSVAGSSPARRWVQRVLCLKTDVSGGGVSPRRLSIMGAGQ